MFFWNRLFFFSLFAFPEWGALPIPLPKLGLASRPKPVLVRRIINRRWQQCKGMLGWSGGGGGGGPWWWREVSLNSDCTIGSLPLPESTSSAETCSTTQRARPKIRNCDAKPLRASPPRQNKQPLKLVRMPRHRGCECGEWWVRLGESVSAGSAWVSARMGERERGV